MQVMAGPPPWAPALAAVLSATLGGSAVVATRLAVPESDALSVAAWRYAGSAAIMIALALWQRRLRFAADDVPALALLGVLQFAFFAWLFTAALQYVPAARGALVLSTMPLLTLGLGALFGRERLTWFKAAGALAGVAGVAVALGERASSDGSEVWKGDALMFAAALVGSLYNVLSSLSLRRASALTVSALQLAAGAATLWIVLFAVGDPASLVSFSATGWTAIAYLMCFGGAASFFLWIWALEHTTPSRVAIAVTINPLSAALLGAVVLAEPLTGRLLVGLAGVILGVLLANWTPRARPAASRHAD